MSSKKSNSLAIQLGIVGFVAGGRSWVYIPAFSFANRPTAV